MKGKKFLGELNDELQKMRRHWLLILVAEALNSSLLEDFERSKREKEAS